MSVLDFEPIKLRGSLFEPFIVDNPDDSFDALTDVLYCKSTVELNGDTRLTMIYPSDGQNAEKIAPNRLLQLRINNYQDAQFMRIYSVKKTLSKANIEVKAEHVTNDLRQFIIPHVYVKLGGSGTGQIRSQAVFSTMANYAKPFHVSDGSPHDPTNVKRPFPFEVRSDAELKTVPDTTWWGYQAVNCLELLGGVKGSLLDYYGGEYERDNAKIYHKPRVGANRGFRVEYGLNMRDVEFTTDLSNTYWGIMPHASYNSKFRGDVIVTMDDTTSGQAGKQAIIKGATTSDTFYGTSVLPLDVTDKIPKEVLEVDDTAKVKEWIIRLGNEYIMQNRNRFVPSVNMKIDFASLIGKPEYEQFDNLQKLNLGDDVQVVYPEFGIDVTTRLISYEYDILTQEYSKLELGQPTSNFVKDMNNKYSDLWNKTFAPNTRERG